MIYQEPTLFPDLSVTENIFMGRQPTGALRRDRPQGDARPRPSRSFSASASRLDPDRPSAASRSPTSRSSRSPGPSADARLPSWTSHRRSSARGRPPLSGWPGASATKAARSCSSRTASTKCAHSATPSRSSATAPDRDGPDRRDHQPTSRPADGRPPRDRALPEAGGDDRRGGARGRGPDPAGRVQRHLLHAARG